MPQGWEFRVGSPHGLNGVFFKHKCIRQYFRTDSISFENVCSLAFQ